MFILISEDARNFKMLSLFNRANKQESTQDIELESVSTRSSRKSSFFKIFKKASWQGMLKDKTRKTVPEKRPHEKSKESMDFNETMMDTKPLDASDLFPITSHLPQPVSVAYVL